MNRGLIAALESSSSQKHVDNTRFAKMNKAKPGQSVQFHGLADTSNLNGQHGTLEHYHSDMDRWSVRCEDGEIVNAKADNLTLIDGASEMKLKRRSDPTKWKVKETPQDCSFVPTMAVTLWLGWNGICILILLYGVFVARKWERMVIIGFCCASLILPADWPGKGFWLGRWMMTEAEKYFGEFRHLCCFCVYN